MTDALDQLRTSLSRARQSLTAPRQTIFMILQADGPLSMHDLIMRCHRTVDRATVYRTISLFEQLGIVQRLPIGWKYKLELSDVFQHHHHHMTCTQCGTMLALPEDTVLEERLRQLAAQHSFTPQDHQLEVRGLCATCTESPNDALNAEQGEA